MEVSSATEADLIEGRAHFVDLTVSVNGELIFVPSIVIATGAVQASLTIPGAELGGSSDDVLLGSNFLTSLRFLSCYNAAEFSRYFHAGVKTDLFVRRDRPLRFLTAITSWVDLPTVENRFTFVHHYKVPGRFEETEQGITIYFEDGSSHTANQVIHYVVAVQM